VMAKDDAKDPPAGSTTAAADPDEKALEAQAGRVEQPTGAAERTPGATSSVQDPPAAPPGAAPGGTSVLVDRSNIAAMAIGPGARAEGTYVAYQVIMPGCMAMALGMSAVLCTTFTILALGRPTLVESLALTFAAFLLALLGRTEESREFLSKLRKGVGTIPAAATIGGAATLAIGVSVACGFLAERRTRQGLHAAIVPTAPGIPPAAPSTRFPSPVHQPSAQAVLEPRSRPLDSTDPSEVPSTPPEPTVDPAGSSSASATGTAEVIKIGAVSPRTSVWGQVFRVWAETVSTKSKGRLILQFYYYDERPNADEVVMVGNVADGQLDGVAVSAVGLDQICKPVLALQMPGLFTTWDKLDVARDALNGKFEKSARDAGFFVLGWSDAGKMRLMSKGFAVRLPDDVKGKQSFVWFGSLGPKPYMWHEDDAQVILWGLIGVRPSRLRPALVFSDLKNDKISFVNTSAITAKQYQWSSKLDTITEDVNALAIGALVLSVKRLDALPEDLRTILLDTGKIAAGALRTRVRDEDDAAFDEMKGKMTVVSLSPDEKAKWDGLFKQTRQQLARGTFPAELVAKLERLAR
jgi:TRAP-type C4-dicarboxylate transport system substrate-binding protein